MHWNGVALNTPHPRWFVVSVMACGWKNLFTRRNTVPMFPCINNFLITRVCSSSVVVTAYDFKSDHRGSNIEWGLIYYKASITAQGLPEPSSLRGSTLGTRAAEHEGCNWGMQVDWWLQPKKSCVRPHLKAYATKIKSTQLHAAPLWLG